MGRGVFNPAWARMVDTDKIEFLPTMPQLEDGEIYKRGHTFKYVYDLDGNLWLDFSSVCTFFHLFDFRELKWIDKALVRRVREQVSPSIVTYRTVVGPEGVRHLSKKAFYNKQFRYAVLPLFKEYHLSPSRKEHKSNGKKCLRPGGHYSPRAAT